MYSVPYSTEEKQHLQHYLDSKVWNHEQSLSFHKIFFFIYSLSGQTYIHSACVAHPFVEIGYFLLGFQTISEINHDLGVAWPVVILSLLIKKTSACILMFLRILWL